MLRDPDPSSWPLGRLAIGFLAFAWIAGIAIAGIDDGHGVDSQRAALAILDTKPVGFSALERLVVECADDITVEVGPDAGGSHLLQVTVWGRPKVGRCEPTEASINTLALARNAEVHPGAPVDKFVDGATSQVVDLNA